ncbi:OLC1v1026016C1 [Oldenlandia corymbosa var. corymbosa]|uniref:OLC1v1026016C1 n=1 Tax=Oldenlandia corymbosa var. corymbosa TaxID=529605 RepID=A0AAV1C8Y3_OLDCO|nr:OLC1v1026016C1 [Oldenlandia corymbosa var. corymbosa]
MDNKANNGDWEAFDEEDALSLCNLTMQEDYCNNSSSSAHQSPIANDFFEFSNESSSLNHDDPNYHSAPDVIFCGKLMVQEDEEQEELNEYQKRDYLAMVKSNSFRKPSSRCYESNHKEVEEDPTNDNNNKSLRFSGSKSQIQNQTHSSSPYHHHHRHQVQKVNISSLTSMSAKSRRRMFMFGPVKFKPEMELSAIKERQGKRLTTLLSPPTVLDGGKAVVNDGRKRGSSGSHWGVVKSSLRGRAHLSNVLTRSFVFGCIPAGMVGANGGNWVKVAN